MGAGQIKERRWGERGRKQGRKGGRIKYCCGLAEGCGTGGSGNSSTGSASVVSGVGRWQDQQDN